MRSVVFRLGWVADGAELVTKPLPPEFGDMQINFQIYYFQQNDN